MWGTQPDGYTLNMHPIAFAAWFGMLATALNLFPIGQLDGGHISYAVLGPRYSTWITFGSAAVVLSLSWSRASWLVWTGLMVVMLIVFGPRHPRVFDEEVPLDRAGRSWRAVSRRDVRALFHARRSSRSSSYGSSGSGKSLMTPKPGRLSLPKPKPNSMNLQSTLTGSTSTMTRR